MILGTAITFEWLDKASCSGDHTDTPRLYLGMRVYRDTGRLLSFFHGALRPQEPYGSLGTGEEWGRE